VDNERAKQIIFELIRQNGGSFTKKTNLFKAFWHAHLKYAEKNSGVLSDWPIVRMPNGPGIEGFDRLIGQLMESGLLNVDDGEERGPYAGILFEVTPAGMTLDSSLESAELEAIRAGVEEVLGKTAAQVSQESHQRAWNEAKDGHEMNVYLDLSPDDGDARRAMIAQMAGAFKKACG
jgi:hypothetical protein